MARLSSFGFAVLFVFLASVALSSARSLDLEYNAAATCTIDFTVWFGAGCSGFPVGSETGVTLPDGSCQKFNSNGVQGSFLANCGGKTLTVFMESQACTGQSQTFPNNVCTSLTAGPYNLSGKVDFH